MSDRQTEDYIAEIARLVVQLGGDWSITVHRGYLRIANPWPIHNYPFTKYAKPRRYRTLQRIIDRLAEEL